MIAAELPDLEALLPQRGPMRLLGEVISHSRDETICSVPLGRSALFAGADGSVPAYVALEYMAQCAAVHAGFAARSRGRGPSAALLLGSRRLALELDRFPPGRPLLAVARHHRGEAGLVAFDCCVRDARSGRTLAQGRLSFYTVGESELLGERGT